MQTMDIGGLQLPTHDGFERAAIAANPGMDEQARRIDLQVFALHAKRRAIGSDAYAQPFATRTQIDFPLRDVVHAGLTPPSRRLLRIGDGFEDTGRGAAMKISAMTAFWSGVITAVAMGSP